MDRLELIIAVSDAILGIKKAQTVEIQNEVKFCNGNNLTDKYLAVACIAGHYGKDKERKAKLGKYADKVQARINTIYAMRGKSVTQAAKDVINGNYDKESVRELLLKFCGYDPKAVQDKVNRLLQPTESSTRFRIHVEHFCRKDESAYGACTAILQYAADGSVAKCVLIDTAMGKTADVVIADLRSQGVKQIDALFISHAHGDHYGGLGKVVKAFPVKWLYLPNPAELDKYQKTYGNALRRQAQKVTNFRWYDQGDRAVFGDIKYHCLFSPKAKDLKEHDSHHYVNNMSPVNYFQCGEFIWHTDGNATNEALMEATRPKICVSNYHHAGWHSGRKGPKKKAEAVGAKCYATADDGHIEIDIDGKKVTVTTTKTGKHDNFTI